MAHAAAVRFGAKALAGIALVVGLSHASAEGHPTRGSIKWSVILCRFADSPAPPRTPDFYREMLLAPKTGGMADYWSQTSRGAIDLQGSEVVGWYVEPFTIAQAVAQRDVDRAATFHNCVDAAAKAASNPYKVPAGNRIAVITSPGLDEFGFPGFGAVFQDTVDLGGMTHEVAHGMGFQHSFSDDPGFQAAWGQVGEYNDRWDAMSWPQVFAVNTAKFGAAPPLLN